jgi:hypothetical protein
MQLVISLLFLVPMVVCAYFLYKELKRIRQHIHISNDIDYIMMQVQMKEKDILCGDNLGIKIGFQACVDTIHEDIESHRKD